MEPVVLLFTLEKLGIPGATGAVVWGWSIYEAFGVDRAFERKEVQARARECSRKPGQG